MYDSSNVFPPKQFGGLIEASSAIGENLKSNMCFRRSNSAASLKRSRAADGR